MRGILSLDKCSFLSATQKGNHVYVSQEIVALVESALKNPQMKAVKGYLLFEARRAELRWPRPAARILALGATATDFFAYFFPWMKKVGPRRRGDSLFEA